jgi:hypothetical protein
MAAPKLIRRLVISKCARNDLAEIWKWDAKIYSPKHAYQYLAELYGAINLLT